MSLYNGFKYLRSGVKVAPIVPVPSLPKLSVLALVASATLASPALAKGLSTDTQASQPAVEGRRRSPVVTTVDATAELKYMNQVNRERAARGLPALVRDDSLRDLARYHSADMALGDFVGLTSPQSGALLDRASAAAGVETVEVAGHVTVGTDFSRGAAALLDPSIRRVGVGVVAAGGRLFLTHLAISGEVAAPVAERYTADHAVSVSLSLSRFGQGLVRWVSGAFLAPRAFASLW